jgi:hypothetical protein
MADNKIITINPDEDMSPQTPSTITIDPNAVPSPQGIAAAGQILPNKLAEKNIQYPAPAPKTFPMFAPTGEQGEIPVEKAGDAAKNGFIMGRHVISKDGQSGIVPENRLAEALKGGMKRDRSKPEGPNQLQIGSPEYTSDPSVVERILATKPPMKGPTGDFTVPPVDLSKMNPTDAHEEIMNAGTATLEGAMTP